MKSVSILLIAFFAVLMPVSAIAERQPIQSDSYIKGYVDSIFIHSYGLPQDLIEVRNRIIIIDDGKLDGKNPEQIFEKVKHSTLGLQEIRGIVWKKDLKKGDFNQRQAWQRQQPGVAEEKEFLDITMPNHSLFQPLIADPKWPRFTVAYQYYFRDGTVKHAFAPNFGASFPLYRRVNKATYSKWEIGVQAGLFGIMDIGKESSALVNADYYIGVPLTYSEGPWSGLIRFYHLSSHLGDEFMLTEKGKKTKRINLSYEGIDVLLSYHFDSLRLYGGGGYIVHKEPSSIKPLKIQAGVEHYSQSTFFHGRFRPVIGVDFKTEENGRWYPGVSCKAGIQLEHSAYLVSNKVQLMLEFYSGKSIHGQFYRDKVKYIGLGLQAFL